MPNLRAHRTGLATALLAVYLPALLLLALVAIASHVMGIPIAKFTRDPAAIVGARPFIGVVSNIGILLWCATASVCFFCATLLRRKNGTSEDGRFLFYSGLLTTLLLFDDLFQVHENLLPEHLYIPQQLVYLGYVVLTVFYLFRFRQSIRRTERVPFILALGFFGLSIGIDLLPDTLIPAHYLFEDGFKLLGILSWLVYFLRTSFSRVVGYTDSTH